MFALVEKDPENEDTGNISEIMISQAVSQHGRQVSPVQGPVQGPVRAPKLEKRRPWRPRAYLLRSPN